MSFVSKSNYISLYVTILSLETADSVSISPQSHSGPMVEGTEYQLRCDIKNVAPLRKLVVRWYKGNETIETQRFNDSTKESVNMSSTITITHRRYEGEVEYRCEAELDLGPEEPKPSALSKPLKVTVYCKSFCFLLGVGGIKGLFNGLQGYSIPHTIFYKSDYSTRGAHKTDYDTHLTPTH